MTKEKTIKFCFSVSKSYLDYRMNSLSVKLNSEKLAMEITAELFRSNGEMSFISQIDRNINTVEREYIIFAEIKSRINNLLLMY